MYFSRFATSFYLLSFALLLQTIAGTDPLYHFCSSSEKFIDNGTYETNLNKLMGYLYLAAPPTGFGKGSVGENNDQVNGLALCRGDVSNTDCKACITESSSEIRKRCPDNKAAIIWYDYCLLKYSNVNFFGQVDYQNMFYMWNLNNVSDPASFNQKTKELLSNLAQQAFKATKMYATGELELEQSKKLYGLTQCTRDLSSSDCKKCLDDAISRLPNCCDGKEGGRLIHFPFPSNMCFSKLVPLCLLLLSLLLQAAIGADPLFHFCFIPENYTSNDPFSSNLNELTTLLSSKVPPTGFGFASTRQGQDSHVSSTNCKTCVTKATKELRNCCPYNKGAIIWYDNCLFKYSNVKFFGEIDNKNKFYMYNVQSVDDPISFNVKTKELLSSLSNKAYGSPVLFATGELVLEESMKLYGLAQCTRDLSSLDCKKCLDGARGRVVGGSCNVRYELYSFVNA
ncbi:hypothetical protein PVL29_015547 [Vitis rotundifolia]|uniref:Gnk2-homologous domain-containing protein n=1 Tax=Vitis rotundifolia TaxID=103349 RepID=A0AA38ZCZ4_VITRO|nr:hypothetical protein PVL29_015547 [Vitis rotundifolia]